MLTFVQPAIGVLMVLDKRSDEEVEYMEMRSNKSVTQPAAGPSTPQRGGIVEMGGAEAAVQILNTEDDDGEEAPVPDPFEYETDTEE